MRMLCLLYPFKFHKVLVGWGLTVINSAEAHVETFLEEDTIAPTDPRLVRVGDSDVEIPDELERDSQQNSMFLC